MEKKQKRRRRPRAKRSSLFIALTESVTEKNNVKDYLLHRMGRPDDLDFDIVKVTQLTDKSRGCSMVEVSLSSYHKAGKARYCLNKSNRNTDNKVYCYNKETDVFQSEIKSTKQVTDKAYEVAKEIVETNQRVVGKHEAKIMDMKQVLENIEAQLTQRRGVSLDKFERLSSEKRTREEKLIELESQKREFGNYVQAMKKKILELYKNPSNEAEVRAVRKAFGVECSKLESALPIYARREDILNMVRDNQVSIILGETGSGKSTQIVQYLYQAGYGEKGLIACTQPRKIAATSLATQVSSELASRVGHEVGYQVGMQTKKTALTKVMFMTDHILLNECLRDNKLSDYSCIIIDEAHERSIFTDLLIGMLKECMKVRPELRVVVTSATIDPKIFVSYFGGPRKCPVLEVSGRTYPVEIIWQTETYYDSPFPDDYERKALEAAIEIHRDTPIADGDILVFLTSQVEIERCCDRFTKKMGDRDSLCLPLHGRLKAEEQQLVFQPNPQGKRKVVFATNSAETSITIPGIKFVVDTGVVKEMRYDAKRNMNSLDVMSVSQSSANQRKGRAGRTAPGTCYRLYTETDFHNMKKSNCPEILRIHLGQAILKLMELKVNPMSFDFVECPSEDAMQTALGTLVEIGAVSKEEITELGKWIAKLPVEPRLGAMIKQGIDADVPVEVLVIAASCCQGGIFYRAGSAEEKKEADLCKIQFCHRGGDLLTVLNVYREWDKVNEKCKGGWCKRNYINGKSAKGVREMVKEILTILQKDCNLKIKYELKEADKVDDKVQELLFKTFKSNIAFYLGHEKAGYITVKMLQHVQVHPSSCLIPLGMQPTWVVFSQLLKTTDDFITNITPVSKHKVEAAIEDRDIDIDTDSLEKQKVEQALKVPIGKHMFWKFVGPMHQNRREIESNIKAICNNTVVVIEASKIRGEISLYCVNQYKDDAVEMLKCALRPLPQSLLLESREEYIGNEQSNVRALLRNGCSVIDMLMPHQYRSIKIKLKEFCRYELTEENVEDMFSQYGTVERVWRPTGKKGSNSVIWGTVTFVDERDAIRAVQEISEDEDCDFFVEPDKRGNQSSRSQEFTLRMSWCRRRGRGICYVYVDRPEDVPQLIGSDVIIRGSDPLPIQQARAQSDLMIKGLFSDVTEEEVKQGLAGVLGINLERNSNRFKVIIPRENLNYRADEVNIVTNLLSRNIQEIVPATTFNLHVKDFKEKTVFCNAFLKFYDAKHCETVANELEEHGMSIGGTHTNIIMEFKGTAFVHKNVYEATKEEIDEYIRRRNSGSSAQVTLRVLRSQNSSIDITAKSPKILAKVKLEIDTIIDGDTFEAGSKENLQVMFTAAARQKKQQIEKSSHTIITINEKAMKVTVQGLWERRQRAVQMIEEYIAQVGTASERQIPLKGGNNPPGFMKAIIVRYKYNLSALREQTNLVSTHLDLRDHVLTISGNTDALDKAEEEISKVQEHLQNAEDQLIIDEDIPDCPVCLCPIGITDSQRLEYCGHAYCSPCLLLLIENAINARNFPILCSSDGCSKGLVIRDIYSLIKAGKIKKREFVDSAVNSFVAKNSTNYKFCITPDCEMVYKVTTDGRIFHCGLCHAEMCTKCHTQFHDGLTCEMYKSAKSQHDSVRKWLAEKPGKRKLCPKCEIGIEKIEGCDHMHCVACGTHICWKCMKTFRSDSDCYGHLRVVHESFV